VRFHVVAFERLALSLDVVSASDISAHVVGLTTNYMAPGARAADTSAAGFVPVPEVPGLNAGNLPFYWVASVDVQSPLHDRHHRAPRRLDHRRAVQHSR
jgi:hypothetical protein